MEVVRYLNNLRDAHRGGVATMGNFDGVHAGHQALLARVNERARSLGVPSVVVTFEPQPREFFRGREVPARLTRLREKLHLLERYGVDCVLLLPFNERTASIPAEELIRQVFVDGLRLKALLIGDDFRFGAGRAGDFAMLRAAGEANGFEVSDLGTQEHAGDRVSSTRIREALAAGDLRLAERLLGHDYFIMGRVAHGRRLGRELGFPTVNIPLQRYRAALEGVFAVEVTGVAADPWPGVANVGIRPTIAGREPLLEVHLIDFAGDLYGRLLTTHFRHRIRTEQKFDGLEALREQIGRDLERARELLAPGAPR